MVSRAIPRVNREHREQCEGSRCTKEHTPSRWLPPGRGKRAHLSGSGMQWQLLVRKSQAFALGPVRAVVRDVLPCPRHGDRCGQVTWRSLAWQTLSGAGFPREPFRWAPARVVIGNPSLGPRFPAREGVSFVCNCPGVRRVPLSNLTATVKPRRSPRGFSLLNTSGPGSGAEGDLGELRIP